MDFIRRRCPDDMDSLKDADSLEDTLYTSETEVYAQPKWMHDYMRQA